VVLYDPHDIVLDVAASYISGSNNACQTRTKQCVLNLIERAVGVLFLKAPFKNAFQKCLSALTLVEPIGAFSYRQRAAEALGKPEVAKAAHTASLCLRYGVAPEVVSIIALGFPNLRRARSRYLYEKGIRKLEDLARGDPAELADPKRAPEAFVREWVSRGLPY
jgi:hypothetical protein